MSGSSITYRSVSLDDVPLLHTWLNNPHVYEWYEKDKPKSIEDITNRYGPKIRGEKPTDCYLALSNTTPFGYIQMYRVNDWPDFGKHLWYGDDAASIDLFIGEPSFMGKGLARPMIENFLTNIVFATPEISTCIITPEPTNTRAIHVYEKAGFRYIKTIQIPGDPEESYIMELKKADYVNQDR